MLATLDVRGPVRIGADPLKPEKAIEWFRSKLPITKAAWEALTAEARSRAFTVAWATSVQLIQSVKDSLTKAIAEGQSFDTWKRAAREDIADRSDAYLETVFRNNVQSAYSAGRYAAQTTPAILRLRPFWRLVVIDDTRTSPICKPYARKPLVLPANDPWWSTNFPPRHHRCRSTTVTLSKRQAERIGVTFARPDTGAEEGWGSTKGLGTWQPDGAGVDPVIWNAAQASKPQEPR